MTKVAFIWAEDEAGWIGKDGSLPWHLPADLKHFKQTTLGHPIVMGATTYKSIGHPLPKRENVVVTHHFFKADGVVVLSSIEGLVEYIDALPDDETCFITGGAGLFAQTTAMATDLYRTLVAGDHAGDTKMSPIDYAKYERVEARQVEAEGDAPACVIEHWVAK